MGPGSGNYMVCGPPGLLPALQAAWLAGCCDHLFIFLPQVGLECQALATTTVREGTAPFVPCVYRRLASQNCSLGESRERGPGAGWVLEGMRQGSTST